MPKLRIARPDETFLSSDKREELRSYLHKRWQQAVRARSEQVDSDYANWDKAYNGIPLEATRTVPYYKSSNFVVKLIRMYVDTFVARTLNIVFATQPLIVCDGLPQDLKEAWELYQNRKALYEWDFYKLTRDKIFRGNKNGTVVTKSAWLYNTSIEMAIGDDEQVVEREIIDYDSTYTRAIPFEDFYCYPITANELEDMDIQFHRVRYTEEKAKQLISAGAWTLSDDKTLDSYLRTPSDGKRISEQSDAGVSDPYFKEVQAVECHLKYELGNDGKLYDIITVIHPDGDLFDVYFNPYPRNLSTFVDYRPLPREDLFYGESMCQLLGQCQEEASVIHNDRRNNSFIANAVCFKRRSGSLIPNPSTNWYPGKVFDLDDLDDLEVFSVGRNLATDLISEEDYTNQIAEKLSGISDVMQGSSSGQMGKRGVYNTMGTIALMQEGNQRQDTNMRDVRESVGRIAAIHSTLQAQLGSTDDPMIGSLPVDLQPLVKQAITYMKSPKGQMVRHEIKSSSAGVNKEVQRANLMQIAQVLGQYGQTAQQMSQQLVNPNLNPGLRLVMNDVVKMQKWMATRLLREFDEYDAAEILPDLGRAIETVVPGGSRGTSTEDQERDPNLDAGGAQGTLPPVSRPGLQALSQMATLPGGGAPKGNVAS